ncbi:hypothetical protein JIX56_20840 [Streptomyces sp. CA-210063]|uniref:hypothetical protein n=1 Tax=Streptomyces sp. CA-210063 TaxID=2801029 RepID=UPI00214C59A8|nr:hypothetical protein [Streptomyces sp. CA-210063]UUU32153.1 hypothetical protein JIX56_20840 [Streptomyces sp. CA-210063]
MSPSSTSRSSGGTARAGALFGRRSQQGSRGSIGNHRPYVARYRSDRAAQRRQRA